MGYRLAAGGLAGRLRAGDGGTGPCIEDAWVRQTARFWTDISQVAARAMPMAGLTQALAATREAALTPVRNLPRLRLPSLSPGVFEICQSAAALGLLAIGSATLVCWKDAHPQRQAPAQPQIAAAAAFVRQASLTAPVAAPAPAAAKPAAEAAPVPPAAPAPPPVLAAPAPAAIPPPPPIIVAVTPPPAPQPRLAHVTRAAHVQDAATLPRPSVSVPRVAPAPRIFTVLATRPMPRPHHTPRAVAAQFDMPRWLTEPRAPLVMSEPPHTLTLPPQYNAPRQYQAPSRYMPRVDRFAEGYYVPPMMPGSY
jgi:hypothetical protein